MAKIISIFNHKGGVGKTTLGFNLACRFAERGSKCLLIDADPQCNMTIMALTDEQAEEIYENDGFTIAKALAPLISGTGDLDLDQPTKVDGWDVWAVPGDLFLSTFEAILARDWNNILRPEERAARLVSAIFRLARQVGADVNADYIFFDLGPSIGPLNQAALLASDYFMIPATPDIYSVRAMSSVGETVTSWVNDYALAVPRLSNAGFSFAMPVGKPKFLGYVPQQFGIYRDAPAEAFRTWIEKLEAAVGPEVVDRLSATDVGDLVADGAADEPLLSGIKNYHSLIPSAQTAHRPIFALRGNIDVNPGHSGRVRDAGGHFDDLCQEIENRMS